MKIKKIAWRNITSYGNRVQRVEFDEQAGFYMLTGDNASGKSSFLNCITFALYGKVTNKNLKDLPNRKNKNAWVRIEMESSGRHVVIERGLAPNVFSVTVDGAMLSESGKVNVQKFLEEEVFRMPYYVFDNLISLNINDFKSFLDMTPADKRTIIDRMFSLDVINQMREILKSDVKEAKTELEQASREIDWIQSSIAKGKQRVEAILQRVKVESESEINELEDKITQLKEEYQTALAELNKIDDTKTKLSKKKDSVTEEIRKSRYAIEAKKKEIEFLQRDSCPTCKREIGDDFRDGNVSRINSEIQEIENNVGEKTPILQSMNETLQKIDTMRMTASGRTTEIKSEIKNFENRINYLRSEDKKTEDTAEVERMITESEEQLETKQKERLKAESKTNFMKVLESILGEGGMKQMAIKNMLPVLNGYIHEFSRNMGSDYDVVFDEEFEAQITHLGEEISPKTLSTGEMKKLDVIVLLSLIKLIKMRFPELNILFLDEIFSSVDHGNVFHVIKMLARITKEMNINTIVVNHSQLPHEEFDYILRTSKSNGFSSIELEKVN